MIDEKCKVVSHEEIGTGYRYLVLEAPKMAAELQPGQFVHVRVPALEKSALRRPFSVFDAGDGVWENDVASSLLFDRRSGKWIIWLCAFSHGHVLARAAFDGEPLYGKSVIDVALVPPLNEDADDRVFGGKKGDEDPDLYYDRDRKQWLLSVCRLSSEGGYRYHFFASDSPLDGFSYIGKGIKGDETGGSFLFFFKFYFSFIIFLFF